jgi:hypothetical protein
MANNQYVVAENWGTGFIEHSESREISFTGHPGNVWQVPAKNGTANKWISKVLGQLKTKDEAQAIVDAEITARQTEWDTLSDSEKELTDRPVNITLEE